MNLIQTIKMALSQVISNKMRTLLTMLGIIISIVSVTFMVSIINGMSASMMDDMKSTNTNIIEVNLLNSDKNENINYEDLDKFENIDGVKDASGNITSPGSITYNHHKTDVTISATTEAYKDASGLKLSKGRFLSSIDTNYQRNSVVIGKKLAQNIFKDENPLGKYIEINNLDFKVVGVDDNSESEQVYIPITSARYVLSNSNLQNIYLNVDDTKDIKTIQNNIKKELNKIFSKEDKYFIFSKEEMIEIMEGMSDKVALGVAAISATSLLVGGIGIMNMMLVSVTERTKEIGIRKALGATRSNILLQFLIESVIISLTGGIIGVIIGVLGSNGVISLLGFKSSIDWNIIKIALQFAMVVGIVFGIMPANKASKLRPIEALKSE